ncbi:MAG: DUF3592 domain-containing protein [Balneola sp.]|jgi:hypothetical protein
MEEDLIIVFIASIAVILGIVQWQKGKKLLGKGIKARAVVYKNINKSRNSDSGYYYPVIRFQTEDDKWITQELNFGQTNPKEVGTELDILYDPQEPTIVDINSKFRLEILPRVLVSVGLVALILGLLSYFDLIHLN